MVIDTSAILAILFNEPDAEYFETALVSNSSRLMSAASVLEASIVIESRLGEAGGQEFDQLRQVSFDHHRFRYSTANRRRYFRNKNDSGYRV